jgi:Na+-transporting NADH:ubiquinone oxidoreductase subunit NqrB
LFDFTTSCTASPLDKDDCPIVLTLHLSEVFSRYLSSLDPVRTFPFTDIPIPAIVCTVSLDIDTRRLMVSVLVCPVKIIESHDNIKQSNISFVNGHPIGYQV